MLGGKHVNRVAAHAESAARKIHFTALVLHAHQLRNGLALALLAAHLQDHAHLQIIIGRANAVNGRNRGHNHYITPLQHAFGGRKAHLLDMVVNGTVFFNEQIALRHISFRLVVIVITHEIFHRVFREKLAEFTVELRRQRFVGRKHNGRPPQPRNHIGHGEGFARAGHAQQGLKHLAIAHAFHQLRNGRGLVARWRVGLPKLKGRIREGDEAAFRGGS